MSKRTIENCSVILNMQSLGEKPPIRVGDKCIGYNTEYYAKDAKHYACDKCKLNIKKK